MIAKTPEPPYYTVIFTSNRTERDNGYSEMGDKMFEFVEQQEGFLGVESASKEIGITVSYRSVLRVFKQRANFLSLSLGENDEGIAQWRNETMHREGQSNGLGHIFSDYRSRVGPIVRDYRMNKRKEATRDSNEYHK